MRKLITIACAISLSGCAAHSFNVMGENLSQVKTVNQAVDIFGMPDKHQTMLGRDIYIWENDGTYSSVTINSDNTTDTSYYEADCTIKVITDSVGSQTVSSREYNGTHEACVPFMEALYSAFKAK